MHQIRSASTAMNTGRASTMMMTYSWCTSLLCGEIPCFAHPDKSRSRARQPWSGLEAVWAGSIARRGQETVNSMTMPFAACGGPLSPPFVVPVCQHANA